MLGHEKQDSDQIVPKAALYSCKKGDEYKDRKAAEKIIYQHNRVEPGERNGQDRHWDYWCTATGVCGLIVDSELSLYPHSDR